MHSCPILPAPLIENAVFSPLYTFASFVKDKVPMSAWVYLWAFPKDATRKLLELVHEFSKVVGFKINMQK